MHAKELQHGAMMHSVALVERGMQGEREAQGKLVQLWYKRIYNFGYKFFFDHDLAMEAAQKTFIAMCRSLPALQDASRFKSWLYTIAVNHCREELRRKVSSRAVPLEPLSHYAMEVSPQWEQSTVQSDNPEQMVKRQELADMLQDCLLELSPEQREVVIMKEFEGMKFREIAETLNISENTAKSRLYYGLTALRKILKKKNITREEVDYEL